MPRGRPTGTNKWTAEAVKKRGREIHGDKFDYEKVIDPITALSDILLTCNVCKYEFTQKVNSHINIKSGCANCNGTAKYNYERFVIKAREVHGNKYNYDKVKLLDNLTSNTKIPIDCTICGNEFIQRINTHVSGKIDCPHYSGYMKYTYDSFLKNAVMIHGDKYDYSGIEKSEKINNDSFISIKCNTCTTEFVQTAYNHIKSKNGGCTTCSGKTKYTYKKFIEKATAIHGDRYYYGMFDESYDIKSTCKVPIKCNSCNNNFMQIVSYHITKKAGCPRCNFSKGEIAIASYLDEYDFEYEAEYRLPSINKKRFDFALLDFKYIIEFDGEQHFEFNEHFCKSIEKFEERKQSDIIKTVEAIKCGYTIIRIGYNIKNIHKYLDSILGGDDQLYVSCDELYTAHVAAVREILPDVKVKIGYTT